MCSEFLNSLKKPSKTTIKNKTSTTLNKSSSSCFVVTTKMNDANHQVVNDFATDEKLFREAVEIVVTAKQCYGDFLQRKLKLVYNRAGRLINQLEAAGIVGGFTGSWYRQVLVPDFVALDQLLDNENK